MRNLLLSALLSLPLAARAADTPQRPSQEFAFQLYGKLAQGDKNVFVSPASVSFLLAMARNGAGGATANAIARTFAGVGESLPAFNERQVKLLKALRSEDPKVELAIANSLWVSDEQALDTAFAGRLESLYSAQAVALDFSTPAALERINGWVKERTRGKIPTILSELTKDDVLVLLNAVYFKGEWTNAFDAKATQPRPFTLTGGKQVQRPMMQRYGDYAYLENDQFQAIRLPYGSERTAMYVFLPRESTDLKAFHKTLDAAGWERWLKALRKQKGSIALPRFKLDYKTDLKEALTALGLGVAFDPREADFKGMFTGLKPEAKIYISRIFQKTFVEVNEKGTEAAAVTAAVMALAGAAMSESRPFSMVVDRPFFVALRDDQTGTLLFMGSIVDPK